MRKPIIGIGADVSVTPGERDRAFVFTTYVEALRRAGAIPVVIPSQPENAADLVASLHGLVLAGGDDCDPALYGEEPHPSLQPMDSRRQANDLALAKAAREQGIPTLGICLGMQMMNVAAGGSLVQDIDSAMKTEIRHASRPENRRRHDVTVEQGTQLASILRRRELNVNSSHHQAIRNVGEGFRVTAHAPDGIVEALEDPAQTFYLGVQWHPEDMTGEDSAAALLGALVEAARQHAATRRQATAEMSPAGTVAAE